MRTMTMQSLELSRHESELSCKAMGPPQGWFRGLFAKLRDHWKRRKSLIEDRRAFETMLALDEVILRDIGVSRDELEWASRLPLGFNAAREAKKAAERRRLWERQNAGLPS
jgi:uncharacterized protein YjiS (DUF1127 family)